MSRSLGDRVQQLPRYVLDRSVRRAGAGGRLLLGGAPTRLFRLTEAGGSLFERVTRGERLASTPAVARLVERWVDAGVVHPVPSLDDAPFGPEDLTIVVPVRDRSDGVARLLDSIARHTPSDVGVLVVDDGSKAPEQLAAAVDEAVVRGSGSLRARLVRRAASGGPAAARNTGAADVTTALVAFVDSDCVVAQGWWAPLLAHFADASVGLVAPRVRADAGAGGAAIERYDTLRSPLDMGAAPARVAPGTRVAYVPSAAIVMRLDDWRDAGGFDETLRVGEDVDLVWRLVASGRRVRYEPTAVVRHEVRPGLGAWVRQRVGYGTSAAALDRRHPGRVAPVVVSPWSLAVWGLVVAGQPLLGAALAGRTTGQLRRRLPDVPLVEVARLALGGHLGAGRQLAHAVVRVWWPVALPLAVVSGRARRVLGVSVVWTLASARLAARDHVDPEVPPLDPVRFAALTVLDEASYGAGVWIGCARTRSFRALLPAFPPRPT